MTGKLTCRVCVVDNVKIYAVVDGLDEAQFFSMSVLITDTPEFLFKGSQIVVDLRVMFVVYRTVPTFG
jgi:hypothetical protein